jgi:hypothetical protein
MRESLPLLPVSRADRHAALFFFAFAACCGGRTTIPKDARTAGPPDLSVGDVVAAHGGFDALGDSKTPAVSGANEAIPGTLRASLVDKDNPVKLDGVLGEWPARTPARINIKGTGETLTFSVALQYDEKSLYVGGEVTERSFLRTERFGAVEDRAALLVAFPTLGGGLAGYEVSLFAGKPGESVGQVRYAGARRGQVAGSQIVEAPTAKGYTFEAIIPWTAFPEARLVRVGLRGAARYYGSEGGASSRDVVATGAGDVSSPSGLPPLLTEAEQSIFDGLLAQKGLAAEPPKVDLLADLAGDGMKERVAVWGSYLVIFGPTYRGGKEYFYRDLGGELGHLEARDVTGRGKEDLVLRRRVDLEGSTREWFEVWSILKGDEPTTVFGQEISISKDGKRVSNAVRVSGKQIQVALESASGWDASSYREPTVDGVEPILLPWGPTKSEIFRFDGTRFTRAHEERQTPAIVEALGATSAPPPFKPVEPKTPAVVVTPQSTAAGTTPSPGGDLSAQVFAQYRRDHDVPSGVRPKFDLTVDVDGDGRPERVVLMGKDIVVFGPSFKGGTQYAALTLNQFEDASDIKDLSARDLTGEGGADLVVRGTRHVNAAGARGAMQMDALFVYLVKSGSIGRIFAIETGRAQGGRRAQGQVQFVPSRDGKGFEVDVRPGRVTGWTERTYPWAQDQPGAGALEPLLLPWGGVSGLRYAWNGSVFARP